MQNSVKCCQTKCSLKDYPPKFYIFNTIILTYILNRRRISSPPIFLDYYSQWD
nr:MAG TPA: hypothetical protein [Caudoviricetes sp.]